MQEQEYYAPWEWQPLEYMANGCCEVVLRDREGNTVEMCSCDYWWLPTDKKLLYTSFRFL